VAYVWLACIYWGSNSVWYSFSRFFICFLFCCSVSVRMNKRTSYHWVSASYDWFNLKYRFFMCRTSDITVVRCFVLFSFPISSLPLVDGMKRRWNRWIYTMIIMMHKSSFSLSLSVPLGDFSKMLSFSYYWIELQSIRIFRNLQYFEFLKKHKKNNSFFFHTYSPNVSK